MINIGIAKADITAFKKGVGMLGYGMYFNTMEAIETNLYARAFVIENMEAKVVLVNCELAFITVALKRGVVEKLNRKHSYLKVTDANLMLTAQHTHSSPGGYDHHGFYNTSIPGFCNEIYETLVQGITKAIINAHKNLEPGSIQFGKSAFDDSIPVAFNRSLRAYNKNRDVDQLQEENRHLAVDRNMYLLNFVNKNGKSIGSINWFGVHTTSISNDNNKVCFDNKGYAAEYLESDFNSQNPNYIAAFAQGICGDVSPKFVFNPKHKFQRGKWEGTSSNDFQSAKDNGRFQYEKAKEIIESKTESIGSKIEYKLNYFDASIVSVSSKYANGKQNQKTGSACLGVSFLEGAKVDGPGMHPTAGWLSRRIAEFFQVYENITQRFRKEELLNKFSIQGKKHIAIETGKNRVLFTKNIKRIVLPGFADPSIKTLKHFHRKNALGTKPWVNQVLPIQIFILGNVALIGLPLEITTQAAKRLTKSIKQKLNKKGVEQIVLAPYANAYAGYITTNEEYQEQMYEGGHTLFGQWTLAAFQTKFDELIDNWKDKKIDIKPLVFSEDEIENRSFYVRDYYKRKQKKAEKETTLV